MPESGVHVGASIAAAVVGVVLLGWPLWVEAARRIARLALRLYYAALPFCDVCEDRVRRGSLRRVRYEWLDDDPFGLGECEARVCRVCLAEAPHYWNILDVEA